MKNARSLHKVVGLVAGPLILIAAFSALGLNHADVLRGALPTADAGPFGKPVLAIAADPKDAKRLLVGTRDGLYRSEDGGNHWEEAVLPVPAERAGAIAFDPARPGTVHVAFRQAGVWRSTDGGFVWEDVALPFKPHEGEDLLGMSLDGAGGLVVATKRGVWRQAAGRWDLAAAPARPEGEEAGNARVRLMHELHEGHIYQDYGVWVTDVAAIALILLVGSGYWLWARTWFLRRRARVAAVARIAERELVGRP